MGGGEVDRGHFEWTGNGAVSRHLAEAVSDRAGRPLRVLFLSVEVEPFAKTGGLGDVAGALPKALHRTGLDVRVCMPLYGCVPPNAVLPEPVVPRLEVPLGHWTEPVAIRLGFLGGHHTPTAHPASPAASTTQNGQVAAPGQQAFSPDRQLVSTGGQAVPLYFVESERYFSRPNIYGYHDDGERFLVYCRAALELCRALNWQPDVIHCNDWHTAIVPNWLKTIYRDDPFFAGCVSVYTIHNLAYQGIFDYHFLELAGIAQYGFLYPQIGELAHVVDLMGRGIYFADVVNTVSERYAAEILSPEYGERLDPLLRERRDRLYGILNGIDVDVLDPRSDPHLPANFDLSTLERREANKAALQREVGLPVAHSVALIGMVGRLSGQKGLNILEPAMPALLGRAAQMVILGTGEPYFHQMLERAQRAHPDQVAVMLTFNTPLAQRIYGGVDIFLMPSRYEPCGLGQMIAMRYGAVPVVRATGGLADTVRDWDVTAAQGNGFTFDRYEPLDLAMAVIRALETYRYPQSWHQLQQRGMASDFSWERSAARYRDLYLVALRSRAAPALA